MKRDTTRAADGEGRPHRCSHEEVSKRSIISSKHSSGLHLWFFHRPDNIPDDASRMTIATSGSHLRGQHRWGWSQCGWAAWGRGERSQRSKPSINFDTSHRLFLSLGTNEYLCNNSYKFFPLKIIQFVSFFFSKMFYYFSIMAIFHVKIETMPLKSSF